MPFLFKDYIRPIVWHGGMKNLDLMDKLTLSLRLHFPYKRNDDGTYNLTNVTLNLMNDLQVDVNNQVYAVKWGDSTPDQDTVSQDYNPEKHVHVYIGGTNQSNTFKDYTIDCYGYNFSKYWTLQTSIGNASDGLGYRIECREVSRRARRKNLQD